MNHFREIIIGLVVLTVLIGLFFLGLYLDWWKTLCPLTLHKTFGRENGVLAKL